jgi:hypothetical protein
MPGDDADMELEVTTDSVPTPGPGSQTRLPLVTCNVPAGQRHPAHDMNVLDRPTKKKKKKRSKASAARDLAPRGALKK